MARQRRKCNPKRRVGRRREPKVEVVLDVDLSGRPGWHKVYTVKADGALLGFVVKAFVDTPTEKFPCVAFPAEFRPGHRPVPYTGRSLGMFYGPQGLDKAAIALISKG